MKFSKWCFVFCFFLLFVATSGCDETPDIVEGSSGTEVADGGPVSCEVSWDCPDSPTAFDICERQEDGGGICMSLTYAEALSAFLTDDDLDGQFAEGSAAEVCYRAGKADDATCEGQVEVGTLYGALSIGDCDDNDAAINSSATEVDDGIDNDCDGKVDFVDPSCVDCDCNTKNCSDGESCTVDTCGHTVPEGCNAPKKVANGLGCNDGNSCTVQTKCSAGVCAGGSVVTCEDFESCTDNSCDPEEGCLFAEIGDGTACDDDSACTELSACEAGVCAGPDTSDCDDGNLCTDDSCDPEAGCENANNTAACDDGSVCTTGDICGSGACNGANTADCNDGNACTDDSCDPVDGCQSFSMENGSGCDDSDACTTDESCESGVCAGGNPADCDDGNLCTDELCDPEVGCVIVANTVPCTDGNACTTGDACADMACVSGPAANCNDGKVCTTDSCDIATGCKSVNKTVGTGCDDGDACTTSTKCSADVCTGGSVLGCNDSESCTVDSCDATTGCKHEAESEGDACNDGKACTTVDVCTAGKCAGTTPANCNDNNPCTTDTCSDTSGCVHASVANATNCDTNSTVCDGSGSCSAGACLAVAALDCDDEHDFTTDSCHPANGCVNTLDAGRCFENVDCGAGKVCEDEPLYHCSPATCVSDADCGADPEDLPAKYQWGCSVGATAANPGTCTTCRDNELDGECGSPELCPAEGTKKSFDVDNDGVKDGIGLDDDGDGSTDEGPCECVQGVVGAGCPSGQTCQSNGDCTPVADAGTSCSVDENCATDQVCALYGFKKGSCVATKTMCFDDHMTCPDGSSKPSCHCTVGYYSPAVWEFQNGVVQPSCGEEMELANKLPNEPECCAGEHDPLDEDKDGKYIHCHGSKGDHPYPN